MQEFISLAYYEKSEYSSDAYNAIIASTSEKLDEMKQCIDQMEMQIRQKWPEINLSRISKNLEVPEIEEYKRKKASFHSYKSVLKKKKHEAFVNECLMPEGYKNGFDTVYGYIHQI